MGANWASGFPPLLSHPQVPPGSALRTGQPPLASSISEPIRATPVATPPAEAPGERRPHAPPTQRPHSARAGPGERGLLPGCWVPASPPLAGGPPSSYLATPSCRGWGFGGCSVSTMLMAAYSLIRNWSEGGSEDGDPCASPRSYSEQYGRRLTISCQLRSLPGLKPPSKEAILAMPPTPEPRPQAPAGPVPGGLIASHTPRAGIS